MRRGLAVLLVALTLVSRAEAQGPAVKYGKWLLVAGSIGMNYLAVRAHDNAEDAYGALESRCLSVPARCDLGPGGQYVDPEIESFYQTSIGYDRQARRWLFAGETALVGAAALFIWELTRPKTRPGNIPFEPEVRSLRAGETGLGVRFGF